MDVGAPATLNVPQSTVTILPTPASPLAAPLRPLAPTLMDATAQLVLNAHLRSALITFVILTAHLWETPLLTQMDALAPTTLSAPPLTALMPTFAPPLVQLKGPAHILTFAIARLIASVFQGTARTTTAHPAVGTIRLHPTLMGVSAQ